MRSAPTRSCTPRSVRRTRDDLAELTGRLVAIESTNPDLVPDGVGEAEIAAFVATWLTDAGLDVDLYEAPPDARTSSASPMGAAAAARCS